MRTHTSMCLISVRRNPHIPETSFPEYLARCMIFSTSPFSHGSPGAISRGSEVFFSPICVTTYERSHACIPQWLGLLNPFFFEPRRARGKEIMRAHRHHVTVCVELAERIAYDARSFLVTSSWHG